ncbi:Mu transposase C-terminal domain-containing protein [Mycobacterium sp. MOTT36Y]|uniref:Mu transposase C-terminal domain-containing protein n=1 Tax=Mycobacterium sp. MOTT36Y TaxID=1168287 RepID=UPI00059C00DA|nr:Mu transposase C-terminal domain-containing protein [Mycobacterium sp. MOTT36Y]
MRAATPIGVGTKFIYDGEILSIIEMFPDKTGTEVLVADRGGTRRFWIGLRELTTRGRPMVIGDDDCPRSDDPGEVASVALSHLDEATRQVVAERAGHVREVLTGYKSGAEVLALPGEPRAEYSADRPLETRYRAKAAEVGCTARTIERWVAAYRDHGEAGLASTRGSDPFGAADPRWVRGAAEVMAEHSTKSKPSRASVIHQTNARMTLTHGDGVVATPSRASAYRILSTLERQIHTFDLSAKRNRDIALRPARAYGKLRPTRPGEYLVMDSTRLDVFALDPITLKWVSVELTVAMDWYTRCITALRLSPTTKSSDVAGLLYQTFRPPPAPADWPREAVWPEHGVPRSVFPSVEWLTGDSTGQCLPTVIPETLVVDHGKAFRSQHINSVCQRLGISIQPARIRTGRDKGILERFFLTVREGLLQHLPGYKGPDVYSRGESPEHEAFFYVDELEQIIRKWVAVVYHNRPHDGLVDPSVPGLRMSPAEMYEHGIARAGFIEAPRDPDLAFEFLKTTHGRIHHYGVQFDKRRYNGPALDGYRNTDSPYTGKAKRRWPIHIDPDDVTRVYFRDPITRKWHTLRWSAAPKSPFPYDEYTVAHARRLAVAQGRSDDPAAAMAALLRDWNLELGKTAAGRRIALKLSRERASLLDGLATEEDRLGSGADAPTCAHRDEPSAQPDSPVLDDHLDQLGDSDDDWDDDIVDDDYYADAFEDTNDDRGHQ